MSDTGGGLSSDWSEDQARQIGQLAALRKSGALSNAEYQAAKARVLGLVGEATAVPRHMSEAKTPAWPPAWPAPEGAASDYGATTGYGVPIALTWAPWILVITTPLFMVIGALLLGVVDPAASSSTATFAAVIAGWVVLVVYVRWDVRSLREADVSAGTGWWGLVGAWAYLLARAIYLTRQGWGRVDQWVAVAVVFIAQLVAIASAPSLTASTANSTASLTLSTPKLEKGITNWMAGAGLRPTWVHCPSVTDEGVGYQFTCSAKVPDLGTQSVTVTIVNAQGDVSWHLG